MIIKAIKIIKLHCMCIRSGGMLIVTGISANIEKLIRICMLHTVLKIAKDIKEVEMLLEIRV